MIQNNMFRGLSATKRYVYGDLVHSDGNCFIINDAASLPERWIAVYPDSVCRSTGFTDNHDNMLYEHDKVSYNDVVYEIVWNSNVGSFMFVSKRADGEMIYNYLDKYMTAYSYRIDDESKPAFSAQEDSTNFHERDEHPVQKTTSVILPCNVNDEAYYVNDTGVHLAVIEEIIITAHAMCANIAYRIGSSIFRATAVFGKSLFVNSSDAEDAYNKIR